jgi:hypothetical protein
MMDVRKGTLWYLVNGARELSWFLGWAMFCSLVILHRPFPFFETVIAFSLACGVTRISMGKGWRMVTVLGFVSLGLMAATALLIHGIYCSASLLWDSGWPAAFLNQSRTALEWIILALNLFLIVILLKGGVSLARRPTGYGVTCNRFDVGLTAFFALFVIKLIALTKGEAMTEDSLSLLFVFPFFLFGLLAIGMTHMQGAASKVFLPGYRRIGIIASFVAAVLLGTGGLLLFFLPGLTAAAQTGYRALTVIGRPLGSVLVAILKFIFAPRSHRTAVAAAEPSSPFAEWDKIAPDAHGWWMELLEKVLGWGMLGLISMLLLVIVSIALFYALKWLLSRTGKSESRTKPVSVWFSAGWALLIGICRMILRGAKEFQKAAELYDALLKWAGRSGLAHDPRETPLEFGARLNAHFPLFEPQIRLIVEAFNREVYGETILEGVPLAASKSAWQFLCSPLHWPTRLKCWFSGPSSSGKETSRPPRQHLS